MSSSPNKLTRLDFLSTVLPQGGVYCVVGIQKGKAQQTFLNTLEEVDQWAEQQPLQNKDAYFSLATYNDKSGRCNGQVKQDTLLSRLFIKFPLILNRGLIA